MNKEPEPKAIDISQWQVLDRNVKITKFFAMAVKMPREFNPQNREMQLQQGKLPTFSAALLQCID